MICRLRKLRGRWTGEIAETIGGDLDMSINESGGGTITIDHEGQPIRFELDCSRPEIVCPRETWPGTVTDSCVNLDAAAVATRVDSKAAYGQCVGAWRLLSLA